MKRSTHNLRAVFFRQNGALNGFEFTGHAGYGEEGNDIVCSAVTSAVSLTCNTITDFFLADADVTVEENRIVLALNSSDTPSVKLLEAFLDHMQDISERYPGVKVEVRER
ncbi:MAG: ribosomal-processing cysteine protease Prp [Oscillospiraceae bacterium]